MAPALDHVDDEMHELNQEADYLDQTFIPTTNGTNGTKHRSQPSMVGELDAQAQVIASLRAQLDDYFGQVTQLNGKLIKSYDRISDLEDQNHVRETQLKQVGARIQELEAERTEHLSALSTGLLVEKANVTSELTRLMEKATEEAARAGEAESARADIEKDLDDLSAGLFDQANTMVAEARLGRARSERKVAETEKALRGAEEIVGILQMQMQSLQAEKEAADRRAAEMRALMGKGKWVDRSGGQPRVGLKLLCLHSPYTEFLQFIAHLRTVRPSMQNPPGMSTLLPLPFLARLASEDSEPTIRLDLAPSLNWLTRRSVLAAIHSGQLTVEPMPTTTLLEEFTAPMIPGHSHAHVVCALCGTSVIESPASPTRPSLQPASPTRSTSQAKPSSWGQSFLKTSLVQTISSAPFVSISRPGTPPGVTFAEPPTHVYIFKLETTSSSGLPSSATSKPTVYPLCTSGWCLARLRSACSLWSYVRTGVVERIWEDEPFVPPSRANSPRINGSETAEAPSTPSVDAAKRARTGIGALWGSVSRTLSNTPSRNDNEKPLPDVGSSKPAESPKPTPHAVPPVLPRHLQPVPPVPPRHLPPPPPRHPATDVPPVSPRTVPPIPPRTVVTPPPLPKRNRPVPPPPPPRASIAATEKEAEEPEPPRTPTAAVAEEVKKPELPARTMSEESQEDFATPTEEAAQPLLSRPLSPANVPLPLSEPNSPLVVAEDPAEQGEPKTADPPALDLAADVNPSTEGPQPAAVPPEETATTQPGSAEVPTATETSASEAPTSDPTPAPPPLPRRAANRARPASLKAPAPVPPPQAPEADAPVPLETDVKVVDQPVVEEKLPVEKPPLPERHFEPLSPDQHTIILEGEDNEKKSIDLFTVSSNGPSELTEEQRLRDSDTSSSMVEQMDKVTLDSGSDARFGLEEELDPAVYVGDTTWEDRAWRELVRLREDMFWARIGGFR